MIIFRAQLTRIVLLVVLFSFWVAVLRKSFQGRQAMSEAPTPKVKKKPKPPKDDRNSPLGVKPNKVEKAPNPNQKIIRKTKFIRKISRAIEPNLKTSTSSLGTYKSLTRKKLKPDNEAVTKTVNI